MLVHDLSGGEWMATARPVLNAAIATMPIASLAGIPAFIGLHELYSWTHPAPTLGNTFYLNPDAFLLRYAVYIVLWNLLAAFALWGPRQNGRADCAGAVVAEWRRAYRAGFLRSLRLDRLDPVAGADVLVVDIPDDSRIRLVQHGARIGAPRGSRKPLSRRETSRPHGRSCRHPPRDDDLLGLRRFHAVSDHLGRKSQIGDPLVFDPDRRALGQERSSSPSGSDFLYRSSRCSRTRASGAAASSRPYAR